MSHEVEQRIRERAYQLWVLNGYSHGRDQEHWCTAEREVIAATPVPAKAKKKGALKYRPARSRRVRRAARPQLCTAEALRRGDAPDHGTNFPQKPHWRI